MVEAKTKLLFILVLVLSITGCGKDDCSESIKEKYSSNIYYNTIFCSLENFTKIYTSDTDFLNDADCFGTPIPFPLEFDGIVIVQGVKVPYLSENVGVDMAYDLDVEICEDICNKEIDFHFILENVDTFQRFEHNETVVVLLDGIDENYTVNFSHEIIPFAE